MIRLNKVAVRDALYTVSGAAPTATDDVSKGYLVGSRWIVGTTEYRCDVNLKDAAVWTVVGSGGGGTIDLNDITTILYTIDVTAPTITDDSSAGYAVGSRWVTLTDEYVCIANTVGAAQWLKTTGTPTLTASDIAAAPHANLSGVTVQSQLTGIGNIIAGLSIAATLFVGTNSALVGAGYTDLLTSAVTSVTLEYAL